MDISQRSVQRIKRGWRQRRSFNTKFQDRGIETRGRKKLLSEYVSLIPDILMYSLYLYRLIYIVMILK